MDTKFWGPSGWKLLHTLTFTYESSTKSDMAAFLKTLSYVLPCKFCRASLTDYYRADAPNLENADTLARWLYKIHNMVNKKLRGQGQTLLPNPTFTQVREQYMRFVPSPGKPDPCESFPGWDFLFSIAYNHPLKVQGSPMPDTPEAILTCPESQTDEELNRWNLLSPERRLVHWRRFWTYLPKVLPRPWRTAWEATRESPILINRRSAVAWLWRVRCGFADGADPYKQVCSRLANYESGCSSSSRARTCRRMRRSHETRKRRSQ